MSHPVAGRGCGQSTQVAQQRVASNRQEYRPCAGVVPRSRGAAPIRGNQPRRVTGVAWRGPRCTRRTSHPSSVSPREGRPVGSENLFKMLRALARCPLQRGHNELTLPNVGSLSIPSGVKDMTANPSRVVVRCVVAVHTGPGPQGRAIAAHRVGL
jgi:hypothetical protein